MKRRKESDGNGFEAWGGYMNAKIAKLQEQFHEDAERFQSKDKISNIFEGVSIFVNGYTDPPSEVLRRLMLQHGGVFHDYQVSGTTHVIANNLPNAKLLQQAFAHVIQPSWITDSIAAGKLLSTHQYLLTARPALQPALPFQPENTKRAPAKTAADSNFIAEFYNNSRLHHLSTMGAHFKQYVGKLKENHIGKFSGLDRLRALVATEDLPTNSSVDRVIMHIDMDSFFVSVALRDRPDLIGRPVAVCHARGNNVPQREGADPGAELALYQARTGGNIDSRFLAKGGGALGTKESMSEVASCSYEARALGVKNGMYLGRALSLCPGLVTVPYDFAAYTEVSYALYDSVAEYTLSVEAVSCDEMFIDCTTVLKATGASPMQFAKCLRNDVTDRTRCPCSTGLGGNKLLARLASRKAKPNGQYYVLPSEVQMFMSEIALKDLPGVGWSTSRKLREMDVENCLDLQSISLSVLKSQLGDKTGETMYRCCRGIDERPVVSEHQRKSVSAEVNYGIRFSNFGEAETFLRRLSGEVSERLSDLSLRGRSITLKLLTRSADAPVETAKFLGHGVCDAASRSVLLPSATSDAAVISDQVLKLYMQFVINPEDLRGVGIQVTKLDSISKARTGTIESFLAKQGEKTKTEKLSTIIKESQTNAQDHSTRSTNISKAVNEPRENKLRKLFPPKKKKLPENQFKSRLPPVTELDPECLKALPEDLQKEILAQYGLSALPGHPEASTSKTVENKTASLDDFTDSSSRDSADMELLPQNLFHGMSSKELRNAISSWVEFEAVPQTCDVTMLGSHVAGLVASRSIDIVDETLLCFWRCIKKFRKDMAEWATSYRSVVELVQNAMVKVYGKPLRVFDL